MTNMTVIEAATDSHHKAELLAWSRRKNIPSMRSMEQRLSERFTMIRKRRTHVEEIKIEKTEDESDQKTPDVPGRSCAIPGPCLVSE
jgi:hypothetical protein